MQRYFFSISYLPKSSNAKLLASRCIHILHGFIKTKGLSNEIGVSFPDWTEQSLGNCIAFISTNKEVLNDLAKQQYFTTMIGQEMFHQTQIQVVPKKINEVRFIHNHTISKTNTSSKKKRMARVLRRAESRGEKHIPIKREERTFDFFHQIQMESKTLNRAFKLHIQKESTKQIITQNFNSYGFATNKQSRGTVPELTIDLINKSLEYLSN